MGLIVLALIVSTIIGLVAFAALMRAVLKEDGVVKIGDAGMLLLVCLFPAYNLLYIATVMTESKTIKAFLNKPLFVAKVK